MNDLKQIQDFFSKPLKENVDKKYNDFLDMEILSLD